MDLMLNTKEAKELRQDVTLTEQRASEMVIATQEDYDAAGAFVREVKRMQKKVEDYWEPMRASTYEAYNSVTKHKKEMLDPLKKTEKIVKEKISGYLFEVERRRREMEEATRRMAQEEMERKLREAAEAEKNGDADGAAMALAEAEVMDDMAKTATVVAEAPSTEGVSKVKTWRIKSIDDSKVPVTVAGAMIRPVDEKAVLALVKATNGKIEIPGVEIEEVYSVRVRS